MKMSGFIIYVLMIQQVVSANLASDNHKFPIIPWTEMDKEPFHSKSGSSSPSCIDFDGDGDFDCFVGTASGIIEYYENVGTNSNYIFARDMTKDILTAASSYSKPFVAKSPSAGVDAKFNFYIGSQEGTVSFLSAWDGTYIVTNSDVFGEAIKAYHLQQEHASSWNWNIFSWPANSNSGRGQFPSGMRVFVGSFLFTTIATFSVGFDGFIDNAISVLGSGVMVMTRLLTTQGVNALHRRLQGTHAAPSCMDMDGDGDLDCIVGFEDGTCALFMNDDQGSSSNNHINNFRLAHEDLFVDSHGTKLSMASPFLYDFDYDGDFDVMVGFDEGHVYYYKNIGQNLSHPSPNDFVLESINIFLSGSLENAAPWCGQKDGDVLMSCYVGSKNGDVFAYQSDHPHPFRVQSSSLGILALLITTITVVYYLTRKVPQQAYQLLPLAPAPAFPVAVAMAAALPAALPTVAAVADDDDDDDVCVICFENPREMACTPCGHRHLCEQCARDLVNRAQPRPPLCPTCRTPLAGDNPFIRIYG